MNHEKVGSAIIPSIMIKRREAQRKRPDLPFVRKPENPIKSREALYLSRLFEDDDRVLTSLFGEIWVRSWPKTEIRELDPDTEFFLGKSGQLCEVGYERWNVSSTIEDAIKSREEVANKYKRGEGEEVLKLLRIVGFLKDLRVRITQGEVTRENLPSIQGEGIRVLSDAGYINVVKDSREKIRDGFINIFNPDILGRINTAQMEMKEAHVWHDIVEELVFFLKPEDKNLAIKIKLLDLRDTIRSDFENLNTRIGRVLSTPNRSNEFGKTLGLLRGFAKDRIASQSIRVRPYTHMASYNRTLLGISEPPDQFLLPFFEGQREADRAFEGAIDSFMKPNKVKSRLLELEAKNRSWLREANEALGIFEEHQGPSLY